MDSEKVGRLFEDLMADAERLGGTLTAVHVNRLLAKRQLSVSEATEVYRQLYEEGIVIEPATRTEVGTQSKSNPARTRRRKVLTHEQEVNLGRQMELGRRAQRELEQGVESTAEHQNWLALAESARHAMVESNLGLVGAVANVYVGLSSLDHEDLCQEGLIGLLAAVERYDHDLGYKFSTYAMHWIRQAITRAIPDRGMMVRLPVHMYEAVSRLRRATRLLWSNNGGQHVTIPELADELDWSPDKVHFVQQIAKLQPVSIFAANDGDETVSLENLIPSGIPGPRDSTCQSERIEGIEAVLQQLSEKERIVLRKRFGFENGGREETLEEVGNELGLTRERIRQIQEKALKKLRGPRLRNALREFDE